MRSIMVPRPAAILNNSISASERKVWSRMRSIMVPEPAAILTNSISAFERKVWSRMRSIMVPEPVAVLTNSISSNEKNNPREHLFILVPGTAARLTKWISAVLPETSPSVCSHLNFFFFRLYGRAKVTNLYMHLSFFFVDNSISVPIMTFSWSWKFWISWFKLLLFSLFRKFVSFKETWELQI